MELQFHRYALGFRRPKGFIQRAKTVDVQIVQYQHDQFDIWVAYINKLLDLVRPIQSRALLCDTLKALPTQGLEADEDVRRTIALVFVILALGVRGLRWNSFTRIAEQLRADFIHTDQPNIVTVGPGVDLQHIFHMRDKLSVGFGWNTPFIYSPGLEFVFLSV